MNPNFKIRWVTALRSGDYEQGKYRLKGASCSTFCCLGVALDLKNPEKWNLPQSPFRLSPPRGYDWGLLASGHAGQALADELELPLELVKQLAHMNDGDKSFAEIADYIESHDGF